MDTRKRRLTESGAMARLVREDAVGQLRRHQGKMAQLGSEDGALKLDWVGVISRLTGPSSKLGLVEAEAEALLAQGIQSLIWAGMGGSVLTVRALNALGFGSGAVAVYPLDSTDPAALNTILRAIPNLDKAAMVAVALGMTSEEPVSHLEWFASVLREAGRLPNERQTVIALPGSYLERYALDRGIPTLPLQPDGRTGVNGRMSAPGTRVFLLPAALWLAGAERGPGALQQILERAGKASRPPLDPMLLLTNQWALLACALAAAADNGIVRMSLETPPGWETVRDWTEQLMEESLGKDGRGIVVVSPEALPAGSDAALRVVISGAEERRLGQVVGEHVIVEPLIASVDQKERLAGLAALFLGLQLTMALYGYLWDIPFAGQPAVEAYKSRARELRDSRTLELARPAFARAPARSGPLALFPPKPRSTTAAAAAPAAALAAWLRAWRATRPLGYLDLTVNGEAEPALLAPLEASLRRVAVDCLSIPYKLRRAPAAYHSTEQSEMDGPADIASLRALALAHETVSHGVYSTRFLEAQAMATWQAMNAHGRPCFLALYDGDMNGMITALATLLEYCAATLMRA